MLAIRQERDSCQTPLGEEGHVPGRAVRGQGGRLTVLQRAPGPGAAGMQPPSCPAWRGHVDSNHSLREAARQQAAHGSGSSRRRDVFPRLRTLSQQGWAGAGALTTPRHSPWPPPVGRPCCAVSTGALRNLLAKSLPAKGYVRPWAHVRGEAAVCGAPGPGTGGSRTRDTPL